MKPHISLAIASFVSVLLLSFHLADDIVRGFSPGGLSNVVGILIMVVWLYGTFLVLAERRSGYVIVLLLSLLGSVVPVIHMRGAGLAGGRLAHSTGQFFFIWTLLAVGATTIFSVILSARGLWASLRTHRGVLPSR